MAREHVYKAQMIWTGASEGPTATYEGYSREYTASVEGKPELVGSADPTFRGDVSKYNPEEMLVIALSACHLLSYLAECAWAGISVIDYSDEAWGKMAIKDGRMRFVEVMLRPRVVVAKGADLAKARALHEKAHDGCFIANSVNFPVMHEAEVVEAGVEG